MQRFFLLLFFKYILELRALLDLLFEIDYLSLFLGMVILSVKI